MRSAPFADVRSPWRLPALPIIALAPAPPRPVLALASPDEASAGEEDDDYGMRKSQLPTLPGPLWAKEEIPTMPMFDGCY